MKTSKLTARSLAYALRAVGRKVAKARREAQTPHGKQSVKKLMAHGAATSSIEVDAPKVFDRVRPEASWRSRNRPSVPAP